VKGEIHRNNSLLTKSRLTAEAKNTRLHVMGSGFASLGRPAQQKTQYAEAHGKRCPDRTSRLASRYHRTQTSHLIKPSVSPGRPTTARVNFGPPNAETCGRLRAESLFGRSTKCQAEAGAAAQAAILRS
jgi:hypothetical protein